MRRIVVVGTTGSGKSTYARKLAERMRLTYIQLDTFLWAPQWQQRPQDEYRALLREAMAKDGWVIDGNTSKNRDWVWGEADTVIWLNYSLWVTFPRLLVRTIRRAATHEEVFDGCVETFRSQFLSTDSLLIWFFKTFWKRKKMYREIFNTQPYPHLQMIEVRSPRAARAFVEELLIG